MYAVKRYFVNQISIFRGESKAQSQPEFMIVAPVKIPERASSAPPVSLKETSELFLSATEKSLMCRDQHPHIPTPRTPPRGVAHYDKETAKDTFSVPVYAPYIFSYLKSREVRVLMKYL
jgi:hypothetical protein